ncbi:putative very-long-chain 3-oxoacyl-CoA synthase [Helianthus anomalus]
MQTIQSRCFPQEILAFMKKTLERFGLGEFTYVAKILFEENYHPSLEAATREVEMNIFGAVDMLLAKASVRCKDIGILTVNCCIYNTSPSLSNIVVRYKFREDTILLGWDAVQDLWL